MKFINIFPFFLFFILLNQLSAQEGSLFLTNLESSENQKYNTWSITQDKYNNMLFANRKGIMRYDGEKWSLIKTPSMPYELYKEPKTQRVFVGCNQDYGYLKRDEKGFYRYVSLAKDTLTPGEFMHIEDIDSVLYFMSEKYFTRFDPETMNHQKRWYAEEEHPFTGIIHNDDHVFINVWNIGLHRLQEDTLFPIVSGFYVENNEILFNIPYNKNRILLATDDNKLYLFDGMKFYHYRLQEDNFLEESIISGAVNLTDSTFALSTFVQGVIIINRQNKKIVHNVSYKTGLPDDEVFAMYKDANQGLWLSHEKGISRVDTKIPVSNFSTYPGLKGDINNVIKMDSSLYVATSEGLYHLSEEKQFAEEKITVRVEQPIKTQEKPRKEEEKEEKKKFVKKFFNKIFKSKEEKEEELKEEKSETPEIRTRTTYRTRKVQTLQSISRRFEKIRGVDGKCMYLLNAGEFLLAGTNYGLYQVDSLQKVEPIIEESYIYQVMAFEKDTSYLLATKNGILKAEKKEEEWNVQELISGEGLNEPVYSLAYNPNTNILWAGSDSRAFKIEIAKGKDGYQMKEYNIRSTFPERYYSRIIGNEVYLFSSSNILKYDNINDLFHPDKNLVGDSTRVADFEFIFNQEHYTWLSDQNKWILINKGQENQNVLENYLNLFNSIENIYLDSHQNLYVVDQNKLYKISLQEKNIKNPLFKAYFASIKKGSGQFMPVGDFKVQKENVDITIRMAAPDFIRQESVEFQYKIDGMMDDWSEWTNDPEIQFFTRKGEYAVKARARNIWGQVKETDRIYFEVPPPFTETAWFYILAGAGLIIIVLIFIRLRERKLMHDKRVLEQKVRERTATIEEQKEEITAQRDQILETKNEVQKKNDEITDSIYYARRIQNALLPLEDHFYKAFQDHFILYKPRDIVSGDFYWIYRRDPKIYITAADCTGHGVPGAFMSMLGISFLNQIVSHDRNGVYNAADVLNNLRDMVKKSLRQENIASGSKDGMDMGLCIVDKKKNVIDFAGAYNPMILFKDDEMHEIKADRMPVGVFLIEQESFTNKRIEVSPGDTFYIFSDGYVDQFGGPKGKKFKKKTLLNLLKDIYDRSMDEQLRLLNHNFEEWKGNNTQVDDVIMVGIKI